MFVKLTRTQAAKMADAVNNWHNYDNSGYNKIHQYTAKTIITATDIMNMKPIFSKDEHPYPVYAIQHGDVTIFFSHIYYICGSFSCANICLLFLTKMLKKGIIEIVDGKESDRLWI
jgi:hypothetical protein